MDYLGTEISIPHPRINVATNISKWDCYDIIEDNGIKFVIGTSLKDKDIFENKPVNSPLFLYELLHLYTEIPPTHYSRMQSIVNSLYSCDSCDSVNKRIIKFCKKYGLPFWSDYYTIDFHKNPIFDSFSPKELFHGLVPLGKSNRFPIASFCYALNEIHYLFLIIVFENEWIYYDEGEHKWIYYDDNVKQFLCDNDIQILNLFYDRMNKKNRINTSLYQDASTYTTYWNNDLFCLQLECNNLFHLAIYYLCLMRQSKSFSGGYIRTCKKCNQLFVTDNPRKQFCNNPCTRQAYYSEKKRKEGDTPPKQ